MPADPTPSPVPRVDFADLTVASVLAGLETNDYLADEGLATLVLLALRLRRPLLLEGDPGVGKTEVAKTIARWTGGRLIRLSCYEGIDATQALYEWDHARQLLHLRSVEAVLSDRWRQTPDSDSGPRPAADTTQHDLVEAVETDLYSERFLIRRPLLDAIASGEDPPPVLLIDEIDRADDEFEAFLLEALADYSVTVPELGTVVADPPPVVIITSNRTRDVHDALRRRCLYHWVEHPTLRREIEIIHRRVPAVGDRLAAEVAALVQAFRSAGLYRPPGVAESIDWASALSVLGLGGIDAATVDRTMGTVVKYREDQEHIRRHGVAGFVESAVIAAKAVPGA